MNLFQPVSKLHQRYVRAATICLLASAIAFPSANARADRGFYLGAGGGGAKYNGFNDFCRRAIEELAGTGLDNDCDTDETVFGWKLFGGWRFNPYVAIEGGWVNLGEAEDETTVAGQTVGAEISVDGWFAELVGSVPVGESARLLGKIGGAALDLTLEGRATGIGIDKSHQAFLRNRCDQHTVLVEELATCQATRA